jgi:4-hydroxy-tetrahydrodipicolinate synthase
MNHRAPFSGVLTAIATPMKANGKSIDIDYKSFDALVQHQKNNGIHGIVVGGTTGEGPTLCEGEKKELLKIALSHQSPEFKIYVGTGSHNTQLTALEAASFSTFQSDGKKVDGVMTVTPYYNKPTQSGLLAHFRVVAEAVGNTPLCLYNVPGRTSCFLAPSTVLQLAKEFSHICAIKEAAGDVKVIAELAKLFQGFGRRFEILSGDDLTFLPALASGATGIISVSTHVIPKEMIGIYDSFREGQVTQATQWHLKCLNINTELFCAPNPIPLKFVLHSQGRCEPDLRLPLTPLEDHLKPQVKQAMASMD